MKSVLVSLLTLLLCVSMKYQEPKVARKFETDKTLCAKILTAKGEIICTLDYKHAPLSCTNFCQLAEGGFYNGLLFHRVVPKFVVQGGDPEGTGRGGLGYTTTAEIGLKHEKGALAWARLPDQFNPEKKSSGSQFYITLEKVPYLDGEYTVFGNVISGMEFVEKLVQGDKILKIDIFYK